MSDFKPFGFAVHENFKALSQYELFVAGENTELQGLSKEEIEAVLKRLDR